MSEDIPATPASDANTNEQPAAAVTEAITADSATQAAAERAKNRSFMWPLLAIVALAAALTIALVVNRQMTSASILSDSAENLMNAEQVELFANAIITDDSGQSTDIDLVLQSKEGAAQLDFNVDVDGQPVGASVFLAANSVYLRPTNIDQYVSGLLFLFGGEEAPVGVDDTWYDLTEFLEADGSNNTDNNQTTAEDPLNTQELRQVLRDALVGDGSASISQIEGKTVNNTQLSGFRLEINKAFAQGVIDGIVSTATEANELAGEASELADINSAIDDIFASNETVSLDLFVDEAKK